MKINAKKCSENYLERRPKRAAKIAWSADREGLVTLDAQNTGFFNRIAQKLFHRPEVTHIHLDPFGSFVWPLLDGEQDIIFLGTLVEKRFGADAWPLYGRLARYMQILDSYHLLEWEQKQL